MGTNGSRKTTLFNIISSFLKQGKARLIIEHNTDFIEEVADEILFLYEGVVKLFNNYTSLKNNAEAQEAYL